MPARRADGTLTHVICSYIDVTVRKRAEEALEHRAIHDRVTDLPHRTLLEDRLAQAILTSRRRRAVSRGSALAFTVHWAGP